MSRKLDFNDGFTTSSPSTSDILPASDVTVTPTGSITATNVQDALEEIQTAATNGDADTLAAANAYTDQEIADLINASPEALDTLNELAQALGDDPNFATTVSTALGNRVRVDTAAQGLNGTQKTNAKTNLDLQNVDNTSDMDKPLSDAQAEALGYVQADVNDHKLNFSNPHDTNKAQIGLGDVTNDAQLKRAAGDINSFTEKTSISNDDLVLIEDSGDSFKKKKVKKSNFVVASVFVPPTIQKFTSGSGTYTTPANVKYIRVRMVGGGGGGAGSGTGANGGAGGTGGVTTFGSSLLTANGGAGGGGGAQGGAGGTASASSPAIAIVSTSGGTGGSSTYNQNSLVFINGGLGAASPFGGAGSQVVASAGIGAIANTGSGGGGASTGNANASLIPGGGGGAGGYIEAIISSPASTYSYAVGAAGTAGAAGTSGFVGGAGGSGVIIVEEYYQ